MEVLIDKDMKQKDLRIASRISKNGLAKLGKSNRVGTDVFDNVCLALNCDVGDIIEIVDNNDCITITFK